MATLTVTLPDHLTDLVARRVAGGEFADESACVRAALEHLERAEATLTQEEAAAVQAGIKAADRGDFVERVGGTARSHVRHLVEQARQPAASEA